MQIYLPIAEMAVPAEEILLVSAFVGFLSGALGVGGGFLTTPFLIFLGIPPSVAVGTQASQLVASSTAGVLGHLKRGAVDTKIALLMLIGGFVGSVIGIGVFRFLENIGQIDFVISYLYILLLGGIGLSMLAELIFASFRKKSTMRTQFNAFKIHPWVAALPYKLRFPRSKLYISALMPLGIGFIGGVLATLLGIGGGFILVPAMIYILGMPTLLVAGTSLFQMLFTTSFALIMHATLNQTVDIVLAGLLILGGVFGAQIGASVSRFLKDYWARGILTLIVLMVATKLCLDMFLEPEDVYNTVALVIE